jgi:hypothetical protein
MERIIAADPANEARVAAILRAQGAAEIEQAQGEWHDRDWTSFEPAAVPRLVAGTFAV